MRKLSKETINFHISLGVNNDSRPILERYHIEVYYELPIPITALELCCVHHFSVGRLNVNRDQALNAESWLYSNGYL
jgi:hypothetical protein